MMFKFFTFVFFVFCISINADDWTLKTSGSHTYTQGEDFSVYTLQSDKTYKVEITANTLNPSPQQITTCDPSGGHRVDYNSVSTGQTVTRVIDNSGQSSWDLCISMLYWGGTSASVTYKIYEGTPVSAPVWTQPLTYTATQNVTFSVDLNNFIESGSTPIAFSLESGGNGMAWVSGTNLMGKFTSQGTYYLSLNASNDYGSNTKTMTVTVGNGAPALATGVSSPFTWNINKDVENRLNAGSLFTGADIVLTVSGQPSWSYISGSDLVANPPTSESRSEVLGTVITATNSSGSCTCDIKMVLSVVLDAFHFTSPSSGSVVEGKSFTYTATTTGGSSVSYSLGAAPSFISMSGQTITGNVPVGQGDFSFTISATDIELGTITMTVNVDVKTQEEENDQNSDLGSEGNPSHVLVDNFEDFGNTSWAKDMLATQLRLGNNSDLISNNLLDFKSQNNTNFQIANSRLSAINNSVSALGASLSNIDSNTATTNTKLDTTNSQLSGVNTKLSSINTNATGIKSDTGAIANNTGAISGTVSNILSVNTSIDGKVTSIDTELKKQTGVLESIKDLLDTGGDSPTPEYDPAEIEKVVHDESVSVPLFNSLLSRSYSQTAPVLNLPLHHVNENLDDVSFDFNESHLYDAIQMFRAFEIGVIALCCLWAMFNIVRSFEV